MLKIENMYSVALVGMSHTLCLHVCTVYLVEVVCTQLLTYITIINVHSIGLGLWTLNREKLMYIQNYLKVRRGRC